MFLEITLTSWQATTFDEWQSAAVALDEIHGNNAWKHDPESTEYDADLVEAKSKQLEHARISCDLERILFLIRTSLTRELGDMGNPKMYKHSYIGTKSLIERYINTALETLDALVDVSAKTKCEPQESNYILEQLLSTRQAFGRSALLLSGGATFGMNHIGVIKALWEAKLMPRIVSGASAGSIVCAVFCTRLDEEVPQLLEEFCTGDLAVFEEEGKEDNLMQKVTNFLKHGAVFDIKHLIRVMRGILGDITFQEAYNRTRKILNICVSSASLYELPQLLNYVTAPTVLIWSAVAASCSVPFIFSAASILAKDTKTGEPVPWNSSPQQWIDGSVANDLPMTRLAEMFNVNHFIVSQVNPHVIPFLMKQEDAISEEARQENGTIAPGSSLLRHISVLARDEALHRMNTLAEMGWMPNTFKKVASVVSQKYSGDITILPQISYADFPRMLANPTPDFMRRATLRGERATWPKLSRIRNHCAIELALDDAVQKLRARIVFERHTLHASLTDASSRSHVDITKHGIRRNKIIKRPLSYHGVMQNTNNTSSIFRQAKSSKHKKSLSASSSKGYPLCSLEPSEPTTAPEHTDDNRHPHDVTSSGADTSNISTSASNSSLSSSHTDLPSPVSPTEVDRPASFTRSQPATPGEPFLSIPHPPTSRFGRLVVEKDYEHTAVPSLPEQRYKRMFHRIAPSKRSGPLSPVDTRLATSSTAKNTPKSKIALPVSWGILSRNAKGGNAK